MKNKIVILIILFMLAAVFSCGSNDNGDEIKKLSPEEIKKEYLRKNMSAIDITDSSFIAFADFNETIKNYDIILIGESHSVAKNYDIQFYLLKNCVENHGIKYILTEEGFASSQLHNKYLQTGDKSILDGMFEQLSDTAAYSLEYYNYLVNICEYNKTLPDDKKLVFVGIDIQHQVKTGLDYLYSIWGEISLETLDELQDIIEDMNNNPEIYKEYLGEEYFNFKFACENILQLYDCYEDYSLTFNIKREKYICDNFVALSEYYGNVKYFGTWGDAHANLISSQYTGGKTLAVFLNDEYEPTKTKVLTVMPLYYNCRNGLQTDDNQPSLTPYSIGYKMISLVFALTESDFTLFNLINDGSPFFTDNKETTGKSLQYGHQYFLAIKDSPAATKFDFDKLAKD